MSELYEIKNCLDNTYRMLDTVEELGCVPSEIDASLRKIFQIELHSYFMYLSATDGQISMQERDFMNYLFDMNLSSQDYVNFINENNIYSVDFENKIPLTFQILQEFDKKIMVMQANGSGELKPITPMILKFYIDVGKAFISCDGASENEITEAKTYFDKLIASLTERLEPGLTTQTNNEDVAFVGMKKGGTQPVTSPARTPAMSSYGPSVYKVGVDIPSGEYKVYPESGCKGYFAICKDANCDDIIRNDNIIGQSYINISNGQFLKLTRCNAVPISSARNYTPTNGIYADGEYKVGVEIPAGEYRVIVQNGMRGYYAIEHSLPNGDREIRSNDNFQNAAYVSINNGEILKLSRCYIQR